MRILIFTHFYPPETGAAPLRIKYFVDALIRGGYDVKIISPRPNYPGGKLYEGFEKLFKIYHINNITYLPILYTNSNSVFGRMISYISYSLFSFIYALLNSFKPTVIISSSPPLITALAAAVLSKIKKTKFILDIRDIWPDIGVELGILKSGFNIGVLKRIEKFILNQSNCITVTAEGDKQNLIKKGLIPEIITIVYNGADYSLIKPIKNEEILETKKLYNLPLDKKIIVYFGSFNYGMNDIETLGESLKLMNEEKDNFHFLAIGDGLNKDTFINKLKNQIFITSLDSISSDEIANLLPACDISVIPRKFIKNDTGGNLPVKCFESWAAGLPVVLSTINNNEIVNIFKESNGGVIVEPQNPKELQKALSSLLEKGNLNNMGLNAREYSIHKFSRSENANKLNLLLQSIEK
jgi:putative colanic acid biosynthesis glycosyltransferase WcaI